MRTVQDCHQGQGIELERWLQQILQALVTRVTTEPSVAPYEAPQTNVGTPDQGITIAETTLTDTTNTQTPGHEVILTETAVVKVASPLAQEGRDDLRLRVTAQPGGCFGPVYQLYFDERLLDGDAVCALPTGSGEMASVEVVIDRMSMPYLPDVTIDFADTTEKQGFTIDNPNAVGSYVCGESFR